MIRCDREDRAIEIVECGLKLDPDNEYCQSLKASIWKRRAEAARQANGMAGLVDAFIHVAEAPASDFRDTSEVASTFNQSGREIEPDPDRRRLLALRLARVLEARIGTGNATDCSRLGWVLMNAGETERARNAVDLGLRLDPQNKHCLRLKTSLA